MLARGEWDAAAEAAELISQDIKIAAVARIPALAVLARVRLRRGDPGVSKTLHEAAELAFASGEVQRIAPVVAARAEASWIEGTLADSLDEIRRGYTMTCKISDSVSAMLEKLQVRSRGEAAAVANRLGLGTPGKPTQATKH